jgi:hypothetical protein
MAGTVGQHIMASKRQIAADQKAQSKALAKKQASNLQPEQRFLIDAQQELDACDDSPNLLAEFVLTRQIIQYLVDTGADRRLLPPWFKLEESLSRCIISTGLQLSILIPHASLRDAAIVIANAADDAFRLHAPEVRAEAIEWLKNKLGETLLNDDLRSDELNLVALPPAKEVYEFEGMKPASPNLSLGGSLKLMRWYIKQALKDKDWNFVLLLVKQVEADSRTQLSLAKTEGLLVSKESSSRIMNEMTRLASAAIERFAGEKFEPMIDHVRDRVCGPPKTTYEITQ